MLKRTRQLGLIVAALALPALLKSANLDGSSPAVGDAEAVRLYKEANDFVSGMAETQYSYSYLQFYWKRAQGNIDRIRRVYPTSPTALALGRGELKIGPYDLDYFRDRVLYNLEVKRVAAFEDVNCAIFLYGRNEARSDAMRDEALTRIVEVLSRRQRWAEAMRFPVLAIHRPLLLGSIFKVAAFYDQPVMIQRLTAQSLPSERQAAGFDAIQAEALAMLGKPRTDLYKFVADHPTDAVRTAALRGIVNREILIRRMEAHHLPPGQAIQTVHDTVQNIQLRDNIESAAAQLFIGNSDRAAPQLAVFSASQGTEPDPGAGVDAHLAYMRFLAESGSLKDVAGYAGKAGLSGSARKACDLKAIELLAEAGDTASAEAARIAFSAAGDAAANEAALAEFRGSMDSRVTQLVVRERSFADLPITDPCVMAIAIMDWSLTPNRSQRGATPWDAVVAKFARGFENLPKPKSAAVGDAASTLKPY